MALAKAVPPWTVFRPLTSHPSDFALGIWNGALPVPHFFARPTHLSLLVSVASTNSSALAAVMAAPGIPGIPAIPPVQGKAEMALDAARVYADEEAKRKRLECRFYEAQYPEIEEVVMVNVRNIAEMGAYVVLLEYNDIEGMILLSELSRRRIRSINKLIRVNRNEVAMVLRVDKEKVCTYCGIIVLVRAVPEGGACCSVQHRTKRNIGYWILAVSETKTKGLELRVRPEYRSTWYTCIIHDTDTRYPRVR